MDEISSLRNTLADTKMALADQESVMQRYEDDIIELRAGTPSSADNSPGKQMNQSSISTEFNTAMGGPSVRLLPPLSLLKHRRRVLVWGLLLFPPFLKHMSGSSLR